MPRMGPPSVAEDFRAFKSAVSLKHGLRRPRTLQRIDFRAFKSAVSLKRHTAGGCGGQAAIFPRLQKRGLIEAMKREMRLCLPTHFRAFKSAVSLKHGSEDNGKVGEEGGFPRLQKRGLIEALLRRR